MSDDENLERQENELIALESIYDDRQFKRAEDHDGAKTLGGGQINIFLEIPDGFILQYMTLREKTSTSKTTENNKPASSGTASGATDDTKDAAATKLTVQSDGQGSSKSSETQDPAVTEAAATTETVTTEATLGPAPRFHTLSRQVSSFPTEITVNHLPPICLNFSLPADYPVSLAPTFSLSCKWLNAEQLSRLCQELDQLWEEQGNCDEILFLWAQFLLDDSLSFLGIESPFRLSVINMNRLVRALHREPGMKRVTIDLSSAVDAIPPLEDGSKFMCDHVPMCFEYDGRAMQEATDIPSLVTFLVEYDKQESTRIFETSYHDCTVCFIEKRGVDCCRFSQCQHTYCEVCMRDYFTIQINEGSVRALTCPEDECQTQADPALVKRLVSEDTFLKYDKFLLQSTLDTMLDIVYCPRCQTACIKDDKMAQCQGCNYIFCALCKKSYHGVASCPVNSKELLKLRDEYLKGSPAARLAMEQRYGKRQLEQAVNEHFTEAWMQANCKACPTCKAQIEKIDGCNKMTCFKCRAYFCWLCMRVLNPADPYLHYGERNSECFQQLFRGIDPEHEDFEINFEDLDDEDHFG